MMPGKPPDEELVKESIRIVEKASEANIVLRIIGAVAVYIHSMHVPKAMAIYDKIKRLDSGKSQFTDLDLVAYGKQRKEIMKFFEKTLGFKPEITFNAIFGNKRMIYHHPKGYYHVDIFFDKLEFSHDIGFGSKPGHGRLEFDFPTITLEDIVLEKVQIHKINLKDIVDLIILFAGHDVSESKAKEVIDGTYIANILSDDWGFWYDARCNLSLVKQFADKFHSEGNITDEEYILITDRVKRLLKMIEEKPKTKNWLKRAEKGTSKPWYREIEDIIL